LEPAIEVLSAIEAGENLTHARVCELAKVAVKVSGVHRLTDDDDAAGVA